MGIFFGKSKMFRLYEDDIELRPSAMAALGYIREELSRVWWNVYQDEIGYNDPFCNGGAQFLLPRVKIRAYDWGWDWDDHEDEEREPNFEWRDLKIWWYKYYPRGVYANRQIKPEELDEMIQDCLDAFAEWENWAEDMQEREEDYFAIDKNVSV